MDVTRDRIVHFRARAMHLAARLPAGSLADAARAGLQDSAPRTAILSLHARVEDVGPTAWEQPELAQVWGPRMAVYVVPRVDVEVFTRGRLPRDGAKSRAIEEAAAAILGVLDHRERSGKEVATALKDESAVALRLAGPSGRLLLRWDTRISHVLPADPPTMDPEDARIELGRRYLRWLGPGTPASFARWAGVDTPDAKQTWRALEPELADVGTGWILAADLDAMAAAHPVTGVRLLPPGDPFLATARHLIVPDERARAMVWPSPKHNPRLPSGKPFLPGAILLDGEVAGIWARVGARVTLFPFDDVPKSARDGIARVAEEMKQPIGSRIDVRRMD